ncbi:DEKNAAC103718 [Brettanomyces naardenensis]|uniref:Putative tyrosine-protein phosphatase OCA1 n=1 Tax=Brettanomyces naardenensis TaxID=13370 RepID=A0A448YNY0_BRENA|nr:DEKNAAC103718 [Brettanomyces naardenensis]
MLVPPDNFALVEDGIYRCSKLDPINHSFLDTLNLKSIVWMDEEKPARMLVQYVEENKIKLYHMFDLNVLQEDGELSNPKHQDWMVLKPSLISRVFQILLNSTENHNCLLIDKSEVVVGILRHIERWCYSSIVNEYRLFSTNKTSYNVESFLELVNVELVPCEEDEVETEDGEDNEDDESIIPYDEEAMQIDSEGSPGLSGSFNTSHAISIEGRRPSWAVRRMSAAGSSGFGDRSPLQSSLSSSKLSISTSPQIPMNLLKLVEDRRQKKRQKDHHHRRRHESFVEEDELEKPEKGESPRNERSNVAKTGSVSEKSPVAQKRNRTGKRVTHHFYKPKADFKVINVRNKVLPTTIRVRLPKEDDLPKWFIELRDSWEAEYKDMNNGVELN